MTKIVIYTDGGSRGNPGPSALGVYITDENGNKLFSAGKRIGNATNNIAEYSAVMEGFNWLLENKDTFPKDVRIEFYMDSQLAYSQLVGRYKVKNEKIRQMLFEIKTKEQILGANVYYMHVPREKNKKADEMVNLALDYKI
ncbi:MAG: ribonuclease HI family protein [Candidatus Levybacteria bacterium]|nr:ribonuclease HI family protein [Candidatus Levybacteria bacterium]